MLPSYRIFESFAVEAVLVAAGFYVPQGQLQLAIISHPSCVHALYWLGTGFKRAVLACAVVTSVLPAHSYSVVPLPLPFQRVWSIQRKRRVLFISLKDHLNVLCSQPFNMQRTTTFMSRVTPTVYISYFRGSQ